MVESNTDIYALVVLALELIYEQYPVTSDGKGASNRYRFMHFTCFRNSNFNYVLRYDFDHFFKIN